MNVQDKQRGQESPVGSAGTDADNEARDIKGAEPTAPGQGCLAETAEEQTLRLKSDIKKAMGLAAEMAGVTERVLTSRIRWEVPCLMRQIAAYWLNEVQGWDKRQIGRLFCRDRSSVYHAVARIKGLLAIGDRRVQALWEKFNERITDYKPTTRKRTMGVLHDLEGMPEWQKKREYLARLLTNLTFEVADVLETLFVETEEKNRECGYTMRQEEKRHFKAAMHHIKTFRGATRALEAEQQESFGQDAEMLLDLIYAAVSRTGTDDQMMHRFLNYIMSFPDRVGLDGVRKGGEHFEAIKMQQAKERIERMSNDNN